MGNSFMVQSSKGFFLFKEIVFGGMNGTPKISKV
jgi:hypothetical protein